jgi:hypothetical protein
MAKRIRKQCSDLTAQDFERFPIWEYAIDEEGRPGQDEATVRPSLVRRGTDLAAGDFLVLGVFSFPNGRARLGVLTVGGGSDVAATQPSLFRTDRLLNFYLGALLPPKAALKRDARFLVTVCDKPFPIHYGSVLRDRSGSFLIEGVLEGFYKYGGFDKPVKKARVA